MECFTIELKKKKLSEHTAVQGKTKLIKLIKYYDLDGMEIDEGTDNFIYNTAVDFKVVITNELYYFNSGNIKTKTATIYVNNKPLSIDEEITGYAFVGNTLVLHGCTGCG